MEQFKKILVVVDATQEHHPELQRAIKLADQSATQLLIVDIVKPTGPVTRLLTRDYAHIHQLLIDEKQASIDLLVSHCKAHSVAASGAVHCGASSHVTIEAACKNSVDLIVRSTRGIHSLETTHLGMSAQKLLRRLPCPTWLVDPASEPDCKTIVATVDASPGDVAHQQLNRRILEFGTKLAKRERAKLIVAYAWSLFGAEMLSGRLPQQEFDQLLNINRKEHTESFENLLAEFNLHANGPNARLLDGEPSSAIPQVCRDEQADLLICGTVARTGLSGLLLGNTAERIVNRVSCSILAITPSTA